MIHDPLIDISTVDVTTYLVLGVFGQSLDAGESSLRSESYSYGFNEGQLLNDPATAYNGDRDGDHPRNLSAQLIIEERGTGMGNVTVVLNNTVDGEDYPVHAHDMADPSTTPNGTPYNETPNGNVFATAIEGTGSEASAGNMSTFSFNTLTRDYEGFFVVHDPLQELTTVDVTTYLILGATAR